MQLPLFCLGLFFAIASCICTCVFRKACKGRAARDLPHSHICACGTLQHVKRENKILSLLPQSLGPKALESPGSPQREQGPPQAQHMPLSPHLPPGLPSGGHQPPRAVSVGCGIVLLQAQNQEHHPEHLAVAQQGFQGECEQKSPQCEGRGTQESLSVCSQPRDEQPQTRHRQGHGAWGSHRDRQTPPEAGREGRLRPLAEQKGDGERERLGPRKVR